MKTQRIQCDLAIPSGRESPRKRYHKLAHDEGVQTEAL
jgi:hypothetical protein